LGAFLAGRSTSIQSQESIAYNDDYPLLAKRLFIENPSDVRINFSGLRTSLRDYVADNNLDAGIYFEYLPTGSSIRVNGNGEYRAASLIKLPVAMEVLKAREVGLLDLSTKVQLKQEWLNDGFGTLYQKGAGHTLTLEEALEILLTESDNTALRVLIDATANLELENRALGALDIEFTASEDGSIDIGARSYSSFFKCLYFACYNTKADSEKILDYLTRTEFNNRIAAGIEDKGIKIAHKIGVFNTEVQSDCGIIYLPEKNYVLCVIIAGTNDGSTDAHIANISRLTFEYLDN